MEEPPGPSRWGTLDEAVAADGLDVGETKQARRGLAVWLH